MSEEPKPTFYRQPEFWKWCVLPVGIIVTAIAYLVKLVTGQ